MKKIFLFLIAILFSFNVAAQEFPNNEVKLNIANVIAMASVEIGYEFLFDYNQSVDIELMFNDRMNYQSQSGSRNFKTTSIKIAYNYYFGTENPGSGLYVFPMLKYRMGEFTEERNFPTPTQDINFIEIETDMNAFIIGAGAGFKWNFTNSFVASIYGSVGRNFSDEVKDRFQAIEFHAGVGVGYRF